MILALYTINAAGWFALGLGSGAALVFLLIAYFTRAYAEPAERAIEEMRARCTPDIDREVAEARLTELVPHARYSLDEWEPECGRCRGRGVRVMGGICGNCADDLRQEAMADRDARRTA